MKVAPTSQKSSKTVVGLTPAHGRKLTGIEKGLFQAGFANLNGVLSVARRGGMEQTDDKFCQAFDRVVATSPLLQTQIEGDSEQGTFQKVPRKAWPRLQVLSPPAPSDDELMPLARKKVDQKLQQMTEEGHDSQRKPIFSTMILRSPNRIAWMIVAPHHFVDGVAIGSIFVKFCQYARLPKALWPLLDKFSDKKHVPTYWEMGLKSSLPDLEHTLETLDYTQAASQVPKAFRFEDYNYDPAQLRCCANARLVSIPNDQLYKLRQDLRLKHNGLTITSIFGGLSMKVLVQLLHGSSTLRDSVLSTDPEEEKWITTATGMDARRLGQWKDRRDKQRRFPTIGCYSFSCPTKIPMSTARQESIEDLAHRVKADFQQCQTDAKLRATLLKATCHNPVSNVVTGCSSVLAPRGAAFFSGMKEIDADCRIKFGIMPRVWFYVLSNEKVTHIDVDIALPMDGYKDASEVHHVIQSVARETCLESFLG